MADPASSLTLVLVNPGCNDGVAWDVHVEDGLVVVQLFDASGEDALVHFEPTKAARFQEAIARALVVTGQRWAIRAEVQADLLAGAMRRNLELLGELDKVAPAEVDRILSALLAHIRSWRPQLLAAEVRP